jgi:hypothetical protein
VLSLGRKIWDARHLDMLVPRPTTAVFRMSLISVAAKKHPGHTCSSDPKPRNSGLVPLYANDAMLLQFNKPKSVESG